MEEGRDHLVKEKKCLLAATGSTVTQSESRGDTASPTLKDPIEN